MKIGYEKSYPREEEGKKFIVCRHCPSSSMMTMRVIIVGDMCGKIPILWRKKVTFHTEEYGNKPLIVIGRMNENGMKCDN